MASASALIAATLRLRSTAWRIARRTAGSVSAWAPSPCLVKPPVVFVWYADPVLMPISSNLGISPPRTATFVLPFSESAELSEQLVEILGAVAVVSGKADEALVKALSDRLPLRRATAALALCRGKAVGQILFIRGGKLTGEEDRYSKTDLWDFDANLQGSQVAVDKLSGPLKDADAELRFAAARKSLRRPFRPIDSAFRNPSAYTTGTRRAATAAGEITSMSSGTRHRSVNLTRGSSLRAAAPSMTKPSKPLLMTSLHFCT